MEYLGKTYYKNFLIFCSWQLFIFCTFFYFWNQTLWSESSLQYFQRACHFWVQFIVAHCLSWFTGWNDRGKKQPNACLSVWALWVVVTVRLHCLFYSDCLNCALCSLNCALCSLNYALCNLNIALCSLNFSLCSLNCALCILNCSLCSLNFTL